MVAVQSAGAQDHFDVINPATRDRIRSVPIFDRARVSEEVARARRAGAAWAKLPIEARCDRLRRVRDVIQRRSDEIADVISSENGKVRQEAFFHDLAGTLATMTYFADNAPRILAPEAIHLSVAKYKRSYISFQPRGLIAVITPWNFPFFMPGADVAMALITGAAVVLKPSEVTPLSALLLKECYDEGGLDPDLFRVVTGLGETGAALIDARPDHVVFTGSVPTGRRIAIACAERFISYTLELGGKAPAIVLDDADLELTAKAITWGGFANAGQICASVERVYATGAVYDGLLARVSEQAGALRVGAARGDRVVDVGAMSFPRQVEVVKAHIADATQKGARITAGGATPEGSTGLFFQPTVLADCNHEMSVMKEEIFGPIVPFMKVKDEDEAVSLANDSHLGLGAYVFTRDKARGRRVAEQLHVGSVMINDVVTHAGLPEIPWGGYKQSGLGVVRSDRGLRELCEQRHINEDRLPSIAPPYWFPYSEKTERGIVAFVKAVFGQGLAGKLTRTLLR